MEEETKKAEKAEKAEKDQKQITKTSSITKSLEKKKLDKGWTKLGGLGANIGGDEWVEKQKKKEKMQVILYLLKEFSGQVKNINSEKIKIPRPEKKEEPK